MESGIDRACREETRDLALTACGRREREFWGGERHGIDSERQCEGCGAGRAVCHVVIMCVALSMQNTHVRELLQRSEYSSWAQAEEQGHVREKTMTYKNNVHTMQVGQPGIATRAQRIQNENCPETEQSQH